MSQAIKILFGGFAIFSMFFGSGNLVFSVMIGAMYPDHWLWGIFGFLVTGALLPFIGLLLMAMIAGDQRRCYEWFGLRGAFAIQLFLVLLLGPLGIAPRSLTVAAGAWASAEPNLPTWIFLLVCVVILGWASYSQRSIVEVIAKYFSPLKVATLTFVIVAALVVTFSSPVAVVNSLAASTDGAVAALGSAAPSSMNSALDAFYFGILIGYQTMDLLGALFYGTIIVMYFSGTLSHQRLSPKVFKYAVSAMAIGMGILSLAYVALLYLGSTHAVALQDVPPTQMLPQIIDITLGAWGEWLVSITIIVSCLTTALALFSASLQFLSERISFLQGRRFAIWLVSLVCIYAVAFTGFSAIVAYLGAILEIIYPIFIGVVLGKIVQEFYRWFRQRKSARVLS